MVSSPPPEPAKATTTSIRRTRFKPKLTNKITRSLVGFVSLGLRGFISSPFFPSSGSGSSFFIKSVFEETSILPVREKNSSSLRSKFL